MKPKVTPGLIELFRDRTVEEKLDLIREIVVDLQDSMLDFEVMSARSETAVILTSIRSEAYYMTIRGDERWLISKRLYLKAE